MKKILLTGLLSTSALAATEPPQFFIGAKGGYQWASDDAYNHSNPNGSLWGVYGGVQLAPSWRWDLGYQHHVDLKADATSVNVKTWLIESALRYDWYLQDNLSLYGRLGAAYWDINKAQPTLGNLDANGFSPFGEIGMSYSVTPQLNLSAGYQYIDSIGKSNTGQYDSHVALISLAYTFGRKAQPVPVEIAPIVKSISVLEEETVDSHSQPQTWISSAKTIKGSFGFDAIQLSDDFVQSLTEVASILDTHPQAEALIAGHADSTGTEAYNQALSERRAQAVVNQLLDLGISLERLESWGEGESNPIADNTTEERRAKNRRVEVTIPSFEFKE